MSPKLPDPTWDPKRGTSRPPVQGPRFAMPCRECGEYTPVEGHFREVVRATETAVCRACLPAARRKLGAENQTVLIEGRTEATLREVLHELGLNVEAHGRHRLEDVLDHFAATVQREVRMFCRDLPGTLDFEPVQGLFLVGPMGVGKSLLAGSVLRWALESGPLRRSQVCYIQARSFISAVKAGYADGSATSMVEHAIRSKLLILDELGTEHATADTVATLTEIMSGREQRPTIVTSNLLGDEVGGRYSDGANEHVQRLAARMQIRNFRAVAVTGTDWRQRAG